MSKLLTVMFLLTLFMLGTERPAHAYLDPGSGSLLLQVIIGAVAAFFFTVKNFWRSILGFFSPNKNKDSSKGQK